MYSKRTMKKWVFDATHVCLIILVKPNNNAYRASFSCHKMNSACSLKNVWFLDWLFWINEYVVCNS